MQPRPQDCGEPGVEETGTVISRARRERLDRSRSAGSGERLRAQIPTAAPRKLNAGHLLVPLFMTRGNVTQSVATVVITGMLLVWLPLYTTFWSMELRLLAAAFGITALWTTIGIVQYRDEKALLAELPFAMPGYLETLVSPQTDRYERYVQATVVFAERWAPMTVAEDIARSLTVASRQRVDDEDITLRVHTVTVAGRWRFELATTGRQRDLALRFVLDRLLQLHDSHPIQAVHWTRGSDSAMD